MATFKDTLLLLDKVSKPLKDMSLNMQKFNKKTDETKSKLAGLEKGLTKIGGALVTAFGVMKITQTVHNISKLGMEFEDVRVDLETMTGSAEKASKLFTGIMTMASKTPFESKDLLDATKQMLSFGIAEKDVLKYSKMLGDISGGDANRFKSLVLAFSQVSSFGKLQGQDRLQMINAGFNPIKELSELTGKSMAQLDKEMSKGKISFDMVVRAMERATSKGGKFYNLMEKRSQTMSGKLSTLSDTFSLWAGLTGEQINKKLLPILDKIAPIIEQVLNKITPILLKLTDMFVYLFNTIGSTEAYQVFAQEFGKLMQDLNLFKQQHQEFFNALAVSFDWLLKTGVPNLLTSIVTVARYILDIISGIMKFFAKLGEMIGKTVGWVLNAIDAIETKLGKSQNISLRGLTYEEALKLASKTDNSIANSYNTTNITNNYQSLFPLTASAGISLGY